MNDTMPGIAVAILMIWAAVWAGKLIYRRALPEEGEPTKEEETAAMRAGIFVGCGSLVALVVVLIIGGTIWASFDPSQDEAEDALRGAYTACRDEPGIRVADDGAVNTFDILSAECMADELGMPAADWDQIRTDAPRGITNHVEWDDFSAVIMSDERFHVVYIVD